MTPRSWPSPPAPAHNPKVGIVATESDAADGVFSDVVVGFEPGIGGKAGQRGAPGDDVAQRLGQLRPGRELALGRLGPGEERLEQRDSGGAMRQPLGGGAKRALSSIA